MGRRDRHEILHGIQDRFVNEMNSVEAFSGDSLEAYENFEAYTIYNGKATFELEEE